MRSIALASLFAAACVAPDVSVEGRPCPCPSGYWCDGATNTCTQGEGGGPPTSGSTSSGAGATACQGVCGTAGCSVCPDTPVIDAGGFLIDSHEVTRGDYAIFLSDAVEPASQPAVCTWNDSFEPLVEPAEGCVAFDGSPPTFAMTCVDWCDAAAYCAWAGKRMCGRIGGGSVAPDAVNDATKSEWYAACSAAGAQEFPYGDTYETSHCNTAGNGGDVVGVLSFPDCEGGFEGLFDMVGNAEEWEDTCVPTADPAGDNCALRGGAFWADVTTPDSAHAHCPSDGTRSPDRSAASHDWGFRCCDDP